MNLRDQIVPEVVYGYIKKKIVLAFNSKNI